MIRFIVLLLGVVLSPSILSAQGKPQEGDTPAYAQAYELLFDARSRALKAIALLLPEGKAIETLNERELSLLARAYNELGNSTRQLVTARRLWAINPGSASATRWMVNSLLKSYAYKKDSKPLFDFVNNAIEKGTGNKRERLILKATAMLAPEFSMKDSERRVAVADLLVEAYASGPGLPIFEEDDSIEVTDSPNFIDREHPFASFFSTAERDALKVRMVNARTSADKERKKQ
ncbi:MAG: hypothetical protein U0892_02845 [Pirellulales bacterium]